METRRHYNDIFKVLKEQQQPKNQPRFLFSAKLSLKSETDFPIGKLGEFVTLLKEDQYHQRKVFKLKGTQLYKRNKED